MDTSLRVLIVVPAYNESSNIVDVVNGIRAAGFDYIVINDGSLDDTLAVCREHNINVIDLPQNLGIGGAVQAGYKYAQRHGYNVAIQFDGDGQHDPEYIPRLLACIYDGADLVIGSRFIVRTKGFQSTFMRRVGIAWLSMCLKLFAGACIKDPTSGFRACGPRALDLFCKSYPMDYPEPDSIATALRNGLDVREVPVEMHERQGGASSIAGLSSAYYMIKVTLAIWIACMTRHMK